MVNLHLQRLSSFVRYLLSSTKLGLTIVLIFMLISVDMINFLEGTNHTQVAPISKSTNDFIKVKVKTKDLPETSMGVQNLSPLQNSNTFLPINNNTNAHQSVINLITLHNSTKSDTSNSDFLLSSSSTSSLNHDNDDHQLISSVHRSMRVKRGLIQLASMIRCVSGCEPFQYKGYGCFCGLFGSGKPVDPIDKCCLKHDQCYAMAPCHQLLLYLMPYSWDCVAPGYANCALTDYEQSKDKCGVSLCECDRVFAECISKYPCPSSKAKCPYKPMVLTVYGK